MLNRLIKHNDRYSLFLSQFTGTVPSVSGHQFIAALRVRSCNRRNQHTVLPNAVGGLHHGFIILDFERMQEANQKRLQDLMLMMRHSDEQESEVRTFIKEIRRYATIEELDEAVLNRLISKSLVGEVKKIDGQKVQKVRIVYNFVGEIPEIIA